MTLVPSGEVSKPLLHIRPLRSHSALHFGGKLAHGFRRNLPAFATRQGDTGLIQGGAKLDAPALTFFPKRKSFRNRFFLAPQPSRLHGVARERSLVGRELYFHPLAPFSTEYGNP